LERTAGHGEKENRTGRQENESSKKSRVNPAFGETSGREGLRPANEAPIDGQTGRCTETRPDAAPQ
jgi:hypothetical protein